MQKQKRITGNIRYFFQGKMEIRYPLGKNKTNKKNPPHYLDIHQKGNFILL